MRVLDYLGLACAAGFFVFQLWRLYSALSAPTMGTINVSH